jgi:DNA-binding HxlR family transcriptional regulator
MRRNVETGARKRKSRRPVMQLLELLGRRWSLRVLWELRGQPLKFRPLQEACAVSPTTLSHRLAELAEAGIVAHAEDGYGLTAAGRELMALLLPINEWAARNL